MWDCLVKLSTWAEGNSGQIQIVVAVAALFFAYKAYLGLMIQLKHSNEQEIKVRSMEIEIKDLMGEFKESEGGDIDSIQLILKRLIPLNSNLGRVGETPDRMRINLRKLKAKLS